MLLDKREVFTQWCHPQNNEDCSSNGYRRVVTENTTSQQDQEDDQIQI